MRSYTLTWGESSNHIPDRPELTATRYHTWSWYREYKVFDKGEDLSKFLEDQASDGTTAGTWMRWHDYNLAVIKFRKQNLAHKQNFIASLKNKKR